MILDDIQPTIRLLERLKRINSCITTLSSHYDIDIQVSIKHLDHLDLKNDINTDEIKPIVLKQLVNTRSDIINDLRKLGINVNF